MSNDNVVDLLSRRAHRGQPALTFNNPDEALTFVARQFREIKEHADTVLLVSAEELDLPLKQTFAILLELRRLLAEHHPNERKHQ